MILGPIPHWASPLLCCTIVSGVALWDSTSGAVYACCMRAIEVRPPLFSSITTGNRSDLVRIGQFKCSSQPAKDRKVSTCNERKLPSAFPKHQ